MAFLKSCLSSARMIIGSVDKTAETQVFFVLLQNHIFVKIKILRKNKAEVIDMILTEYDENEFREFLKEDSWKKGHTAGIQVGIREIIRTFSELQLPKEQLLEKLMNSFSLSAKEAEEYIEKYSNF